MIEKPDQFKGHTPGPWSVILDDTGGPFTGWPSVQAAEELDCAIVHRAGFKQEFWGDLSQRQTIANARLIAAAPSLLADNERLTAENERLKAEIALLIAKNNWRRQLLEWAAKEFPPDDVGNCPVLCSLMDDIAQVLQERPLEAFKKYRQHLNICALEWGGHQCTCGFNQQEPPR